MIFKGYNQSKNKYILRSGARLVSVAKRSGPVLDGEKGKEVLMGLVLAKQGVLSLLIQGAPVDLEDAFLAAIIGAKEVCVYPSVRSSVHLFISSVGIVLLGEEL